jgi:hypothetical protein
MPFEKRPKKEFHSPPKPFRIPDGYDAKSLEEGFKMSAKNTKVPGHAAIGPKQLGRDNSMYRFDPMDLKAMSKRMNRNAMNFDDYIPNSMQPKRPGSRADLS